MLTFNVGPSKLNPIIHDALAQASQSGILEISHRSEKFSEISQETINGLRQFFNIPEGYKIFYTSSATEAMDLAIGNACAKQSFHFVNGAFSQLFAKISQANHRDVLINEASLGELNDLTNEIPDSVDFIALTHNETSTGVRCPLEKIKIIRTQYPEKILAVDITSSAGAAPIDINLADIWFFSVQKCFGLPAGLGIIIISEKAYEKSIELEKEQKNTAGIFTFQAMWKKMAEKYQTICTPNVLAIYLLGEVVKTWNKNGGLDQNIKETQKKYLFLSEALTQIKGLDFFVESIEDRSQTTICLIAREEKVKELHATAGENNIALGKGYGDLKGRTFRIANFPSLTKEDFVKLTDLLKQVF